MAFKEFAEWLFNIPPRKESAVGGRHAPRHASAACRSSTSVIQRLSFPRLPPGNAHACQRFAHIRPQTRSYIPPHALRHEITPEEQCSSTLTSATACAMRVKRPCESRVARQSAAPENSKETRAAACCKCQRVPSPNDVHHTYRGIPAAHGQQ